MRVFKNYFKIVSRHKLMILMYTMIFGILMVVFAQTSEPETEMFKAKIVIIDEANSKLSTALAKFLNEEHQVVESDNADDELFYGLIDAVITIPDGFSEENGILFKTAPSSSAGILVKRSVNSFINKVNQYYGAGFSFTEAIEFSNEDFNHKTEILFIGQEESNELQNYFNFLNYVMMAQIILIVGLVSASYKTELIDQRQRVSPVSQWSQTIQLTLGHIVIGIIVWLVYMIICILVYSWTDSMILLMVNSFVFMVSIITLAVLLSRLITNENTLNAVMNIFTLGSSFLAGAFVPRELMGEFAVNLSRVLPSYYFISNNQLITQNVNSNMISTNIFIMLGFAMLFVLLSVITQKKKR